MNGLLEFKHTATLEFFCSLQITINGNIEFDAIGLIVPFLSQVYQHTPDGASTLSLLAVLVVDIFDIE